MGGDPAKTAELDATEGADTGEISAQAGAGDEVPAQAEAETVFDEIWRPAKRRPQRQQQHGHRRQAARGHGKEADGGAERPQRQAKRHQKGQQGKPPRKPHKDERHGKGRDRKDEGNRAPKREQLNPEHSPFAALMELRDSLAARGRSGQS